MDIVKLTQELVRIPSTTGNEGPVSEFIISIIEPFFDSVEIDDIGNVVAKTRFDNNSTTVLFNTHLDTVDPGDMEEPYSGNIIEGKRFGLNGKVIWGRGSADMKGGIAAIIGAISRIVTIDNPPNIVFHGVVQEESSNGEGTKFAMEHLDIKPDIAISGEPTDLDISLGHRGRVEFELETIGKTAHASQPDEGINAVLLMVHFLNAIDHYTKKLELRVHPLLGKATCSVINIKCSPGRGSVIPDRCYLTFDARYFPDENPQDRENEIHVILNELEKKYDNFEAVLKINTVGMRPYLLSSNNDYLKMVQRTVLTATGKSPKLISWPGGCDTSYLVNDYSLYSIGFGPGSWSVIHTPEEYISIDSIQTAEKIYHDFMVSLSKKTR